MTALVAESCCSDDSTVPNAMFKTYGDDLLRKFLHMRRHGHCDPRYPRGTVNGTRLHFFPRPVNIEGITNGWATRSVCSMSLLL